MEAGPSFAAASALYDPPSYVVAQTPPTERHTITDLHTQILANAMTLFPRKNPNTAETEPPMLVVAKTMVAGDDGRKAPAMDEKRVSLDAVPKHYGLLLRRSNSKTRVKVLLRGEEKDTVLAALEWILDDTEKRLDQMVKKYAEETDDSCCTM